MKPWRDVDIVRRCTFIDGTQDRDVGNEMRFANQDKSHGSEV
jgi:hypothetical protein